MKRKTLNAFFDNLKKLEMSRLIRDNKDYTLGNNMKGDGVHADIVRLVTELREFAEKHLTNGTDLGEVMAEAANRKLQILDHLKSNLDMSTNTVTYRLETRKGKFVYWVKDMSMKPALEVA